MKGRDPGPDKREPVRRPQRPPHPRAHKRHIDEPAKQHTGEARATIALDQFRKGNMRTVADFAAAASISGKIHRAISRSWPLASCGSRIRRGR